MNPSFPSKRVGKDAVKGVGGLIVIAHPVNGSAAGSFEELQALGVHRVSFGPLLQATLTGAIADLVTPWRG